MVRGLRVSPSARTTAALSRAQIAFGNAVVSPVGEGLATQFMADAAAVVAPVGSAGAKFGWYADGAITITPIADASAAAVYQATGAAIIAPIAVGAAKYVYQATGAATVQPVGTASAQIPTINAAGDAIIVPMGSAVSIHGVLAVGAAIISPSGSARVNALHRCGSTLTLSPIAAAQATHTPPAARPIRCRGLAVIRPIGQGQASV